MDEYLLDDHRIFDAGDDVHGCTNAAGARMRKSGHFDGTAAGLARLNVDIEHPLESLGPGHGCATLGRRSVLRFIWRLRLAAFAPPCVRHLHAMFAVGSEYTVKAGEIDPGLGHQGGQPDDEIQGLKDHMGGAVAPGRFQLIVHLAV